MTPLATIGLVAMLAAIVWLAGSLIRVLVGPARGRAAKHAGLAVVAFIAAAITTGSNLAPANRSILPGEGGAALEVETAAEASRTTLPVSPVAVSANEAAPIPFPRPSFKSELSVIARYQTSHTMVSLVVAGFSAGLEGSVAALAKAECSGNLFCSVGIWTDDALAPRKLKMTDQQATARLGHYVYSPKTGIDRALWNCALLSRAPAECLPPP